MLHDGAPARPDLLRRGFRLGEWWVDPDEDRLRGQAGCVHVRPRVMDLIVYLASRSGEVVTKEELLDAVWATRFVAESALSSAIAEARHGLGDDPATPRFLETIPKRGYRLLLGPAPVASQPPPERRRAPRPTTPWPVGANAVFAGRERELALLEGALRDARSGRGGAVFVTGEAGAGKTALVAAFAARVLAGSPEVAVCGGRCPLPVIPLEPCLPFREALGGLAGRPLRGWRPDSPGEASARAAEEWAHDLSDALAEEDPSLAAGIFSPAGAGPAPDPAILVAQLESILLGYSGRRPLLLLLDDLHRADRASLALLARLGRSLPRSRLLVLAAYRPEEALGAPGRGREEPSVEEVARTVQGAGFVRLAEGPDRAFVDALVDAVPNALGEEFRSALFARSEGLPLFAVEILRGLSSRGALAPGPGGRWGVSGPPHWEEIPERAAWLLREEVDALDSFARRVLTAAALEGEEFCLEKLAADLGEPFERVLEAVSTAPVRQRCLVAPWRSPASGRRRVALCRFRHALLRSFLKDGPDDAARRLGLQRAASIRAIIGARSAHDGAPGRRTGDPRGIREGGGDRLPPGRRAPRLRDPRAGGAVRLPPPPRAEGRGLRTAAGGVRVDGGGAPAEEGGVVLVRAARAAGPGDQGRDGDEPVRGADGRAEDPPARPGLPARAGDAEARPPSRAER